VESKLVAQLAARLLRGIVERGGTARRSEVKDILKSRATLKRVWQEQGDEVIASLERMGVIGVTSTPVSNNAASTRVEFWLLLTTAELDAVFPDRYRTSVVDDETIALNRKRVGL
jgi:hypothetical protein